jgi:hypothetical protein
MQDVQSIKGNWTNFDEQKPREGSCILNRQVFSPDTPEDVREQSGCVGYYCEEDAEHWNGEWMYWPE